MDRFWSQDGSSEGDKSCFSKTNSPAFSESMVEGCTDFSGFRTQHRLVKPYRWSSANHEEYGKDKEDSLIIGISLIDTERQNIGVPVRVMNPTTGAILLFQGKTLGYVHRIDTVTHKIAGEEHTHWKGARWFCFITAIPNTACSRP